MRARFLMFTTFILLSFAIPIQAQLAPGDTLNQLTVADGLEISLFAAEPDLRNPTSIDVDARGRVWVLEAANYRLFNQKIEDEKGDRIRVLEDTNGDGRCDTVTTFYQDPSLQSPLAIAVLGSRVYVCQSPDIFYLEDTDNDGKADKKTVVLTGFKGVDHDHAIHGIQFGPDGFLYMSNGDQGLDVVDGSGKRTRAGKDAPYQAATVLRTDLEGKHLEVLASNMRNPYEPTVDSFGNVFISDNDDDGNEQTRINYVLEGGNYGYWNEGSNNRRKGNRRLDKVHWNTDRPGVMPTMLKTGFGSPTGLLFYEGDHLPSQYHRTLIHSDAGPGVIRSYNPVPDGAGYRAEMTTLVSSPEDSWFRPSDVTVGPDGSIFIADWYDAGVGGHRMVDAHLGRIYRLASKNKTNSYQVSALDLTDTADLARAFASPNQAQRFLAHRHLRQIPPKEKNAFLLAMLKHENDTIQARALWLLAQDKDTRVEAVSYALNGDTAFQTQAVRMLSRFASDYPVDLDLIDAKAPDSSTKRQWLLEIGADYPYATGTEFPRMRNKNHLPWVKELQAFYPEADRFYREALGIAAKGVESELFSHQVSVSNTTRSTSELALQYHPQTSLSFFKGKLDASEYDDISKGNILRAIEASGSDEAITEVMNAGVGSTNAHLRSTAFELLARNQGDTWRKAMDDFDIDSHLTRMLRADPNNHDVMNFISSAKRAGTSLALIGSLGSNDIQEGNSVSILRTLRSIVGRGKFENYGAWVDGLTPYLETANPIIQEATVDVLSQLRGEAQRDALIQFASIGEAPRPARLKAIRSVAKSKTGAQQLLDRVDNDEIPEDLLFTLSNLLHASQFEGVKIRVAKMLPKETTRTGESLPSLRNLMRRAGDPDNGKQIFYDMEKSTCSSCHAIDEAIPIVGPNLNKIGEKLSAQAMFESILDPNAAIAHEYQPWIIDTTEDEGLNGYIRSEDAEWIELQSSTDEIVRIKTTSVKERFKSPISIMPSNLAAGMTVDELVDLVAFLRTLK
jgi:putative membrane-bound dehydrogenase-like protein